MRWRSPPRRPEVTLPSFCCGFSRTKRPARESDELGQTRSASEIPNYSHHDAGLHSGLLRGLNVLGRGLASVGVRPPSLAPDDLEAAARKQAGVSDFGPDSYREPLEVLCRSLAQEAELTTFGRIVCRGLIVSSLSSRLQLIDWANRHPEVREQKIERPWVIIGMPRTGTSLLSILLGLDPETRPLTYWEAGAPAPPPELATHGEDPRIARTAKQFEQLQQLNPPIRAMHPFGATLATECVQLFLFDLRCLAIETQAFVPSYGTWLENADMRPAFEMHRLGLQVLQSRMPTQAWSLKTPNYLWCLETLREFYPDARIIWTHRAMIEVLPSLSSLNTSLLKASSNRVDPIRVGTEWCHKAEVAIERAMSFDEAQQGAEWCAHVRYPDLMKDPVAAVEQIYRHFGQELRPLHMRRMQAWMSDRPQTAFGRHVYDPADFGIRAADVEQRYSRYQARYLAGPVVAPNASSA